MKVTEVKIHVTNDEKIKAYVDIIFDNCFSVRGFKLIKTERRYFLAMPDYKRADGIYKDIAFPTNINMQNELELEVLKAYEKELHN